MTYRKCSISVLRSLLSYNEFTGALRWKKWNHRKPIGSIAGSAMSNGYRNIGINGVRYLAHRVAWAICYGKWPKGELDHRNGIRSDNGIGNLRECSRSENSANCVKPRHGVTSKFKGVSWITSKKKWRAQIGRIRRVHIGYFDSEVEAAQAYHKHAKRMYGDFARP